MNVRNGNKSHSERRRTMTIVGFQEGYESKMRNKHVNNNA